MVFFWAIFFRVIPLRVFAPFWKFALWCLRILINPNFGVHGFQGRKIFLIKERKNLSMHLIWSTSGGSVDDSLFVVGFSSQQKKKLWKPVSGVGSYLPPPLASERFIWRKRYLEFGKFSLLFYCHFLFNNTNVLCEKEKLKMNTMQWNLLPHNHFLYYWYFNDNNMKNNDNHELFVQSLEPFSKSS